MSYIQWSGHRKRNIYDLVVGFMKRIWAAQRHCHHQTVYKQKIRRKRNDAAWVCFLHLCTFLFRFHTFTLRAMILLLFIHSVFLSASSSNIYAFYFLRHFFVGSSHHALQNGIISYFSTDFLLFTNTHTHTHALPWSTRFAFFYFSVDTVYEEKN